MKAGKSNTRRSVLIGLSAGIAGATQLPQKWSKPIVDTVLLPVHAETTDDTDSGAPAVPTQFYGHFSMVGAGGANNETPAETILSLFVSEAHAGFVVSDAEMCIDTSQAPAFSAKVVLSGGAEAGLYATTSGVIDGAAAKLSFIGSTCKFNQTGVTLQVSTPTAGGAPYVITAAAGNLMVEGTLPEGTDCPTEPVCIET